MEIKINSIGIGKSKAYKFGGKDFKSAYKKDELLESANINSLGIKKDEQADENVHGGIDKAILISSLKHLEENPDFDKLSMGANILVEEIDENDICIGDVYKIGQTFVEVSQPRKPCWKIEAIFGKEVNNYILENHATGCYVRVLKEGTINIEDNMVLVKRVSDITIKSLSQYLKNLPEDQKIIDEILSLGVIAQAYKTSFLKKLPKEEQPEEAFA